MLRGQKFLAVADGDSIQLRVRRTPAAKKLSGIDPALAFGFALTLMLPPISWAEINASREVN